MLASPRLTGRDEHRLEHLEEFVPVTSQGQELGLAQRSGVGTQRSSAMLIQ